VATLRQIDARIALRLAWIKMAATRPRRLP